MIIFVVVPFMLCRAPSRTHLYIHFGLLALSLTVCSALEWFFMLAFERILFRLQQFDECAAFERAFILYQGTCPVILVIVMLGLRIDSCFTSLILSEALAISTFVCPKVILFVFPNSPCLLGALFLPDHFTRL
jgi:hypothetical protein